MYRNNFEYWDRTLSECAAEGDLAKYPDIKTGDKVLVRAKGIRSGVAKSHPFEFYTTISALLLPFFFW